MIAHWDLDASAVRSEFTTWIRNHCKHFDKLPLDSSMVHWDSIRSSRSATSSHRSFRITSDHSSSSSSSDKGKKDKGDKKSEKKEKEDRMKMEKADKAAKKKQKNLNGGKRGSTGKEDIQDGAEADTQLRKTPPPSNPANAEPEAIQDLEGLRLQLEITKQKAIEKRREYNLEPPPPGAEAGPAPTPISNATDSALDVTLTVEEQHQQQAGPIPQPAPAALAPSGEQQHQLQQQQQGVIPTVVTVPCSPSTTALPLQVPLSASQSTLSGQQQDQEGVQTISVSHPIVKEQTEMEKSLEAIALTLSRHNSFNRLPSATAATSGVSGPVSMPELSEVVTLSEVELAAVATSAPIVVDVQVAPVVPTPLEEIVTNTDCAPQPAITAGTEDIVDTTVTTRAEEIVHHDQEQTNEASNINAVAAIVDSPRLASSRDVPEVVPTETAVELVSTLPAKLPGELHSPTPDVVAIAVGDEPIVPQGEHPLCIRE